MLGAGPELLSPGGKAEPTAMIAGVRPDFCCALSNGLRSGLADLMGCAAVVAPSEDTRPRRENSMNHRTKAGFMLLSSGSALTLLASPVAFSPTSPTGGGFRENCVIFDD